MIVPGKKGTFFALKMSKKLCHSSIVSQRPFFDRKISILNTLMIVLCVGSRTFNIERTTIFIFPFCIGLVTRLNDSNLGVSKTPLHYQKNSLTFNW